MIISHEPQHQFHQIVHIAERPCLRAIPVNGDGLALQGLHDEIGDYPAVVGVHPRAVCVEQSSDLDGEAVLAVVGEEEGFRAAFAFIVAGAVAYRVDVAPVGFGLRVYVRVAVDLGGRGLEDRDAQAFGQAQHVDGPVYASLDGLHRVVLVVDGRCRAGQVVDLVHFQVEREGHVVADQFEARVREQVLDVLARAGEEVVHADDFAAFIQQTLAEM